MNTAAERLADDLDWNDEHRNRSHDEQGNTLPRSRDQQIEHIVQTGATIAIAGAKMNDEFGCGADQMRSEMESLRAKPW